MLALVVAVLMGVVMLILGFALVYTRILGASNEQRTAIEAAALAAAKELGRVVVNTNEFGYVSLSDAAPVGRTTTAGDQYFLPVQGINTLIGTSRLCLIIGDKMGDPVIESLARKDLQDVIKVKNQLQTELDKALLPGYNGRDIFNNPVSPYNAAEDAYKQNQIRMTGKSQYIAGSLRLTLGMTRAKVQTMIPTPKPTATAPVPAGDEQSGYYVANANIPYKGEDFVFAAVGNTIKLVEPSQFAVSVGGLPYEVRSIVKAEADQRIFDNANSGSGSRIYHAVACAQPGSTFDPKPAPGALTISFPDGPMMDIQKPGDMDGQLYGDDCDLLRSTSGDFPSDSPLASMQKLNSPVSGSPTPMTNEVIHIGIYDWIRRAGTKANINAVMSWINTPFGPSPGPAGGINWNIDVSGAVTLLAKVPTGVMHVYTFRSDGLINYDRKWITPYPFLDSSENQLYAESIDTITSNDGFNKSEIKLASQVRTSKFGGVNIDGKLINKWDTYVRDQVRQPGDRLGGKHGGEPLGNATLVYSTNTGRHIAHGTVGNSLYAMPQEYLGRGTGAKSGVSKGGGLPPEICEQSDFALSSTPNPTRIVYPQGPSGGAQRPTYLVNGTAVDIRFRRQLKMSSETQEALGIDPVTGLDLGTTTVTRDVDKGYIGLMPFLPPPMDKWNK